jgi:long-chain acyl-CoA synthetase
LNVVQLALDNIARFGEYPLLHFEGRSTSNVELERRSARLATVLREHGVGRGDRVLMQMPNSPDVLASFLAIWRLGAVPLPATPQLGPSEIRYLLEDSGAAAALTSPELSARVVEARRGLEREPALLADVAAALESARPLDEVADCAPDDLALLLYTSGTTGRPKGVMLSQRATVGFSQPEISHVVPMTRTLHVLPLSHGFGVMMTLFGLIKGMQAAIHARWDTRRVFETLEELRVARFAMVPTMLTYMLEFPDRERYDISSLELVWTGGAGTPIELRREFERVFQCRITDGYGMTECHGSAVAYWDGDEWRPGSAGRALPGVTLRIADDAGRELPPRAAGEVLIRARTTMLGYWGNEEATRQILRDGWIHSGDVGWLDEDGFLYLVGRKKDLIIKGGENVAPLEIEEVLYRHPAVAEAAVVGVPDPRYGEDIWAAVELRKGTIATEQELRSQVAGALTKFKVPTRVVFLPAMPKNATGKIQKREVKEILARAAK